MVWYPAASGRMGTEKGRAKVLEPVLSGVEYEQLSPGAESNTEVLARTDQ